MKKLRSTISVLLLLSMLFGLFSCSGESDPSETTVGTTTATENETSVTDDKNIPDDTASDSLTDEDLSDVPTPTGERLIYFEGFDSVAASSDTATTLSSLGWVKDTTSNGAYANNSSAYSIVDHGGSRRLYIENNKGGATDSYVIVLSSALMGKFHEQNYTYQYDVEYADAGNAKRYIVLVSEYNGQYYNSFHFRNGGNGNNQVHINGSWLTYDADGELFAAGTGAKSIAKKLLDRDDSTSDSVFAGVDVSIRYVVDWENGNSVYMRVNSEGYANTGKWILVSKSSPSGNGSSQWSPASGGAAIVLKTGTTQNGYIDNITIWEGTGDEPADKSSPLIRSTDKVCSGHNYSGTGSCSDPNVCIYCGELSDKNTGHSFAAISGVGDKRCTVCSTLESSHKAGFALPTLPVYSGGSAAKALYAAGHGIDDPSFDKDSDSPMLIISKTNAQQFTSYVATLKTYGMTEVYNYACDGNLYVELKNGDEFVYTYFTASVGETRIIIDAHSELSPSEFGYTYEKKAGDTTIFYQYGVPMNEAGVNISNNDEKKIDCGMMYVMKLADNSVMVLDGGGYQQFDAAQIDGFMSFLRNITGTPSGQKIKIAAWYMSHGHSDHFAGFCLFIKKYNAELDFDRIMFNFPSANSPNATLAGGRSNYKKLIGYIDKYLSDDGIKYIKLHTGQVIQLADVSLRVIYTHEDIVDPTNASSEISSDYNNSSAVLRIEFDGKSIMFLGDINKPAMNVIIANNKAESLKCDIVQLAHHVINDLSKLYNITQAPVVLVPQSPNGAVLNNTRKAAMDAAKKYLKNDMLFYASLETTGLAVQNGEVVKVFEAPVHGGKYGNWSW